MNNHISNGLAAQREGNLEAAVELFSQALAVGPDDVDALRLLGQALAQQGRAEDGLRHARRSTQLAPRYAPAWANLGSVLSELDRAQEATAAFQQALALAPHSAQAHYNLANALSVEGRFADAEQAYGAALRLEPAHAASLLGLGHALKTLGRNSEAVAAYQASLAAMPRLGEAWWSLANLKTYRFSAADQAAMEQSLQDEGLSPTARISVLYARGKALEDAGDFGAAFSCYSEGARLQRERVRYDPAETEAVNERIVRVFDAALFADPPVRGHPDPAPIFIVGLPRSGSTLVEQILASHPSVDGTGELPALPKLVQEIGRFRSDGVRFPEAVLDLEPHDFAALGKNYLARVARHRTDRPFLTDKMPNNFALIGLIRLILPNAKVIDARRHPLDSCMGSFKQLFARGQNFSYDLFELAHYYLEYDKLMQHWARVLPGFVLRVDYESMVQNQEAETRRLLDFCGLPFDSRCLAFHETQRAVNTASSEQVRQPLYRASLWSWRRFGPHLAPLQSMLEGLVQGLPPLVRGPQ